MDRYNVKSYMIHFKSENSDEDIEKVSIMAARSNSPKLKKEMEILLYLTFGSLLNEGERSERLQAVPRIC
jgi:hypothetical protein